MPSCLERLCGNEGEQFTENGFNFANGETVFCAFALVALELVDGFVVFEEQDVVIAGIIGGIPDPSAGDDELPFGGQLAGATDLW